MFSSKNSFFSGVITLRTYTFPYGTSTWTAPTGVTLLVSAVGKGEDGRSSSSGGATEGFGKLFPGGAIGQPAPVTTYTNVSVTPGTTYTIVNLQELTIQYFAP
jgi:hypothetical protein